MGKKLVVEIVGDAKSLQRALKQTDSGLQKTAKVAGFAGAAIFAGLAVVAKKGFDELAQHQKVMAQTEAVLKSTGKAAGVSSKHVEDLANELLHLSGVDDEVVQSGENMLLTFRGIRNEVGKGNNIFDRATRATLDLSVAMGKDMQTSAILVGKALNDPIKGLTALRRVGVQFTAGQEAQIKAMVAAGNVMGAQKLILKELTAEFGGSAKAAGDTLPGQLAKAREAFADVAGSLMLALLPALTALAQNLQVAAAWMEKNPKLTKVMVIGLGALAAALVTASVAQTLLNLAVLANPYVAAAAAIIALTTAVVVLRRKSDDFRHIWNGVVVALAAVAPWLAIITFSHQIFAGLTAAAGAVQRFVGKVKDVTAGPFLAVASAVNSVISAVRTAVGWVQHLIDLINRIPHIPNPFGSGGSGGSPQGGGRGDQAPGSNRAVLNAATGGGSSVSVNFNGPVYGDPKSIAQAVREEFVRMQRNGSKLGFT